ncbi:MAG: GMC oxidoreductase [Patulibacter sp.]
MKRRQFLKSAAGAAVAGTAVLRESPAQAATSTNPLMELRYRRLVPEIFGTLADAPDDSPVVIIGSGFGGAVAAWRLAQAGIRSTVLERGSRWPIPSSTRAIFSPDSGYDGRAFWRRNGSTNTTGLGVGADYFGGVLDIVAFDGIDVMRAAAVGGGSIVYTGAHPLPSRSAFGQVFGDALDYDEMLTRWYPLAANTLGTSTMPDDIYGSKAYRHSRIWDAQATKAGYTSTPIPGIWDWEVMRAELSGDVRASATIGESNYGNANGVKRGLQMTYLKYAEESGLSTVYPGHEVLDVGVDADGRYIVDVQKVDPTGTVLSRRTITASRLVMAAGSIGTTELLMRARKSGALPNLNTYVGTGWGTNGDAYLTRGSGTVGIAQGAASASMVSGVVKGLPVTLENWYVGGLPIQLGVVGSLGMTLDDRRADFGLSSAGRLTLKWSGQADSTAALVKLNKKIASASSVGTSVWPLPEAIDTFTAHPLGGVVLGKATDGYGRVVGHPGLYVMDGALVPGNAGAVNPSITITALAERNIARIIADGV